MTGERQCCCKGLNFAGPCKVGLSEPCGWGLAVHQLLRVSLCQVPLARGGLGAPSLLELFFVRFMEASLKLKVILLLFFLLLVEEIPDWWWV